MSVAASNPKTLITGDVVGVSVRGRLLTAKISPGGETFGHLVPRFLLDQRCNHNLFRAGCGLASGDWKFTATVTNPGTTGFPFTFEVGSLARVSGPAPTYFADWFAAGWMEIGSGATWQRLNILRSTVPASGVMTVTLDRDPIPFPTIGNAVVLYPGCDGRRQTCQAYHAVNNPEGKFNNYLNFGGHPFLPVGNPVAKRSGQTAHSGGKK